MKLIHSSNLGVCTGKVGTKPTNSPVSGHFSMIAVNVRIFEQYTFESRKGMSCLPNVENTNGGEAEPSRNLVIRLVPMCG